MKMRLYVKKHSVPTNIVLRFVCFCLYAAAITLKPVYSLHEDQVGKFDWRRQFLGEPQFLYLNRQHSSQSLIVATKQDVIASVSVNDGSIEWRQLLPKGCNLQNMFIIKSSEEEYLIRTTCNSSQTSYSWTMNGLLAHQSVVDEILKDEQAESQPAIVGVTQSSSTSSKANDLDEDSKLFILDSDEKLQLVSNKDLQVYLTKNNVKLWTREESLALIDAVEFIQLPLSKEDSEIRLKMSNKESLIEAFVSRLKSQYSQLVQFVIKGPYTLIDMLVTMFDRFLLNKKTLASTNSFSKEFEIEDFHRDKFGLRKMIIAVTKPGNIFGIDTFTGNIVWKLRDDNLKTESKNSHTSILITKESDFATDSRAVAVHPNGYVLQLNPISGQVVDIKRFPQLKQLSTTKLIKENDSRNILLLDINDKVHVYPKAGDSCIEDISGKYFMAIVDKDSNRSSIAGYKISINSNKELQAFQTWKFQINSKENILDIGIKPVDEVVHSPARVLGNREVLYKYVNPNAIAILTQGVRGEGCVPELYTNIYLIDGVTGSLIHSINHPKSRATAQLVHSENWLIYSYFNMKSRRTEISSLEMFEGSLDHNSSIFSSFDRQSSIKPKLVEHKSFIFPDGIDIMVATTTLRAMTNRHLIVALPRGSLLEIPKVFLDPRRPINMLMEHREEGLIPYMPELPIPSENFINYNQTLLGVRKIVTSPALLESTSLVFAYGLDLFFTRVTPSKTFDILKDDFDHVLITAVLIILVVASYVTKMLAQRKALFAAWK